MHKILLNTDSGMLLKKWLMMLVQLSLTDSKNHAPRLIVVRLPNSIGLTIEMGDHDAN